MGIRGGAGAPPVALKPLLPGDPRQFGPYRVSGRLGPGGMGDAFLAQADDGWVVVKAVREVADGAGELAARLSHEVEALRRIDSPHVARLIAADLDAQRPWFAMEFIPGLTLGQHVARYGPIPPAQLPALGLAVAEGIRAVHAAGIKHRDLKPDNVVLSDSGPRLIDFGAAELEGRTRLTEVGTVVGTVAWMAPEQLSSAALTAAVDVHAWGLLMLHAATGETPFAADSAGSSVSRVLHETPVVPALLGPQLADLVRRTLAKQPPRRPSVPELVDELTSNAGRLGQQGSDQAGAPADGPTLLIPTARRTSRRGPVVALAGLGLVAIAGGAAVLGVAWGDQPEAGTASPAPSGAAASAAALAPSDRPTASTGTWDDADAALVAYRGPRGGDWSPAIPGGSLNGVRPVAVAVQFDDGELVVHTYVDDAWQEAQWMAGPSQRVTGMDTQVVDTTGGGHPDLLVTLALDDGSSIGTVVLNYGRFAAFHDGADTYRYLPGLEMVGNALRDGAGATLVWDPSLTGFTRSAPPPTATPSPSGARTSAKQADWPEYAFDGPEAYDVCRTADFPLPGQFLRLGSGDAGGPQSLTIASAQAGLRSLNYGRPLIEVTGYFDEATRRALLSFQAGSPAHSREIVVDGVLGPETWAELHRRVNMYEGNCPT